MAKQPQPKKVKSEIVEIDLHAHELLDATAGMSNSEILNDQLDVFRKILDEYNNKKGQKIDNSISHYCSYRQSYPATREHGDQSLQFHSSLSVSYTHLSKVTVSE